MIVGLGHVARTGKDTFASILVERHGFTRIAFADSLREFVYRTDPIVRRLVDENGWDAAKTVWPEVRHSLVEVGNAARQIMGEDVWIRALEAKVQRRRDYVITDVRYPNEVEWVQNYAPDPFGVPYEHRGIVVRVDRPGVEPLPNVADQALADFSGWDDIVHNDGTVDDLVDQADAFIRYWKREDRTS